MQAEIAETKTRNERHVETLAQLETTLQETNAETERIESAVRKIEDELAKKSRELDLLNRRLEKKLAAVPPGEDAGKATPSPLTDVSDHIGQSGSTFKRLGTFTGRH